MGEAKGSRGAREVRFRGAALPRSGAAMHSLCSRNISWCKARVPCSHVAAPGSQPAGQREGFQAHRATSRHMSFVGGKREARYVVGGTLFQTKRGNPTPTRSTCRTLWSSQQVAAGGAPL